jgi:hypothetical protein
MIIGQDHRLVHHVQEDRPICNAKTSNVVSSSANSHLEPPTRTGSYRRSDVGSSKTLHNRCWRAVDIAIPYPACLVEAFRLGGDGVNASVDQLSHKLIELLHLFETPPTF